MSRWVGKRRVVNKEGKWEGGGRRGVGGRGWGGGGGGWRGRGGEGGGGVWCHRETGREVEREYEWMRVRQ